MRSSLTDEAITAYLACLTIVVREIDQMPIEDRSTARFLARLEYLLDMEKKRESHRPIYVRRLAFLHSLFLLTSHDPRSL